METPDTLAPVLQVQNLSRHFTTSNGQLVPALDGVDLAVPPRQFVCIVGPSGCGKSTLLRIIAGLEQSTGGEVLYQGKPQRQPRQEIGMVFQEYSLFPWRNILDNVALGLELAGVPRKERTRRGMDYLRLVEMETFASAYPYELSGGMRQRVAIARALANEPDILLMDEPFGALDAYTRILLQKRLLNLWEKNQKTVLFVTHSVDEAVFLADRIVVMSARPGKILTTLEVNMPRPRDRAQSEYGALVNNILNLLERETAGVEG